jgi:DNA-binding ferritin-like protein
MKTRKNRNVNNVVQIFIELLNVIKLYHWKTKSFPQHKSTDELYASLNERIDTFIEVLLGKLGTRPQQSVFRINAYNFSSEKELLNYLAKIKKELLRMNTLFKTDSDLLNIRDEIMADIHKFEYLLSFH